MSERSGQTAKGKDGKTKYASLNLFDTYKGKSLETQKPVVPPRHGLQSLGKVASARRMPPPANLPSLKAENKGNDPNVTLVPKDGTGWASKQEPADPKSTDALSAQQPESQPPVASQTPVSSRPKTPTAPTEGPAPALGAGARSWAQASVTHGAQGDGGKGSSQPSPFSREEFPTLQAAGDQDKAGRDLATADQWYGPGPSLRPQNVTSWRDGGGRALNAVLPGEGAAEGGTGGTSVMEGAAGGGQPLSAQPQNLPAHAPPRNPPANSPGLPLSQPPVAPQFPGYRAIMPPFMYPAYLPFPAQYAPQPPYRYPQSAEVPRFARAQGGPGPDGRPPGGPRAGVGEAVKRPSILKQDDLKELDELDHDGDEGWAGAHEEIDYSAKLKFSDDEEEGDEERSEPSNGAREMREQQRIQEGTAPIARSRGVDSVADSRRTPPSAPDDAAQPPSSKPGWAEEGGTGWSAQGSATIYQGRRSGLGGPREQPSPPPGPLLGQIPYTYYRQERPSPQHGSAPAPGPGPAQKLSPSLVQQQGQQQGQQQLPPTPPPPASLVHQGEDDDETWRQRRKQSSSEISAAVERARRRREEEERRMEEERRAACAEKLKRLDEKQLSAKSAAAAAPLAARESGTPGPSLSAAASSPVTSQPSSPCVDSDEPPLAPPPPHTAATAGPGSNNRQRAGSNSSYDSNTDSQQGPLPPTPQTLDSAAVGEVKEEAISSSSIHSGAPDVVKVESLAVGLGRQPGGPPSQCYSKYQKSLPPRFQRQQQEQFLKQQQWQQQQQQHNQAAQNQLQPQTAPQGPTPGAPPQSAPKQAPMYPPGSMGRPPPLPMNFDPRWVMMPYMDPRMMQGRHTPMDYYATGMHPSGLLARERSDSGGSGSDAFDRQQPHPGPPHPHCGTPPMDPKLAWGPDVFPGGPEGRVLSSPLRHKQQHDDEESSKGLRSDTPPSRLRDGGTGPIQQSVVGSGSSSGSSNQTPPPPLGTQGVVGGIGAGHLPHHHHQPFMGGRGNYSSFPDSGSRGLPHQQQRGNSAGSLHGFSHQDEDSRGGQQGQIWGAPHPHYDRNGRAELSPMENSHHLHPHHSHHSHPPHFSIHTHKAENGRERERGAETKKSDPSPPLNQPCLSSSCSSSSSSSSARDDNSGKLSLQVLPPQHDRDLAIGVGGSRKQDKVGSAHLHSSHPSAAPSPHHPLQQQQQHVKPSQRGREHKTETQWGPRPGSSGTGNVVHNRKSNTPVGSNTGEEPAGTVMESKVSSQHGGSNANKRAGPIKKPVLREMKREGGEGEGIEKTVGGSGKDKEQELVKQDPSSSSHANSAAPKDDPVLSKSRNGGKERVVSIAIKGSKEGDAQAPCSAYSGPSSRRDRERSYEMGGGGVGAGSSYHHTAPPRGSRAGRSRGEFYGRGRGYRGTYSGSGGGGASSARGRAGGRSTRDYRPTAGGSYHHSHSQGSNTQDPGPYKGDSVVGSGRHAQGGSHLNPGRARNRSETRSEGSEYEEVPKRRRQRGSETGSESAASDLAHSDKEDRKQQSKNSGGNIDNPTSATSGVTASSTQPRTSQTRVFTPRGVPSRRGRGGGAGSGGIYRSGGGSAGMISNSHRSGSSSHSWVSKSSSVRKQISAQPSPPKDVGRGGSAEKKEKVVDPGHAQIQNSNAAVSPTPAASAPAPQLPSENGSMGTSVLSPNTHPNSAAPNSLAPQVSAPDGRGFPLRGFERPPRRRRHGRSQHQQDKPPRFRRLKQERENAARMNGSAGIIGADLPQQRPASPSQITLQDVDSTSNTAPAPVPSANHNMAAGANHNSSSGGHQVAVVNSNMNSHHHHHHHHHYPPGAVPQHHHNHNPAGGAKSPDISNQNSDQANEEWETASESSDFTEFREREGAGTGGVGRSYSSHHHHHPAGRGGPGGGVEREMTAKESAANKRSFSSQRPGMERQNRRVNAGGGGKGPRGPAGAGGGAGPATGSGNRNDRRGNWPSPKNRK